jgi:hypothetical protein
MKSSFLTISILSYFLYFTNKSLLLLDFIIGYLSNKSKKFKVVMFLFIIKFIELIAKTIVLTPVKLHGQFTTTIFSKLK